MVTHLQSGNWPSTLASRSGLCRPTSELLSARAPSSGATDGADPGESCWSIPQVVNSPLFAVTSRRCLQGPCRRFVAPNVRATPCSELGPGATPEGPKSDCGRSSPPGLTQFSCGFTRRHWIGREGQPTSAVRKAYYAALARPRAMVLRALLPTKRMPSIPPTLWKGRVCLRNLSLGPLMGTTFMYGFCQDGLALSTRASLLRISRSMVALRSLVLPKRANPNSLTRSVRPSGRGTTVCGPGRLTSVGSNALSSSMVSVTPWTWASRRSRSFYRPWQSKSM
jgi:hypothetical protein